MNSLHQPIGRTIVYKDHLLGKNNTVQVCISDSPCKGCTFLSNINGKCTQPPMNVFGECDGRLRTDKTDIIYKQV